MHRQIGIIMFTRLKNILKYAFFVKEIINSFHHANRVWLTTIYPLIIPPSICIINY